MREAEEMQLHRMATVQDVLEMWQGVRARMPAFGLIGIRILFRVIQLQTWMRVIFDVDIYREDDR